MEEVLSVWASMEISAAINELLEGKSAKEMVVVHINGKPVALPLTNKGTISKGAKSKSLIGKVLKAEGAYTEQQLTKLEESIMTQATTVEEVINKIKTGEQTKEETKMTTIKAEVTNKAVVAKDGVVEAVRKAYTAVVTHDYKASLNKAITMLGDMGRSIRTWSTTTRTGKAVRATVKYAAYGTVAGAFISTSSIVLNAALVVAVGASLVTTHNLVKKVVVNKEEASIKDALMSYGNALLGMSAFVTASWVLAPYVVAGIAYVGNSLIYGVIHNFVVIFG